MLFLDSVLLLTLPSIGSQFCPWKEHIYSKALDRLLRDLRVEKA
jgi:hypothetical protein